MHLEARPLLGVAFVQHPAVFDDLYPQDVVGGPEVDEVGVGAQQRRDVDLQFQQRPEVDRTVGQDGQVDVALGPRVATRVGAVERHERQAGNPVTQQVDGAREVHGGMVARGWLRRVRHRPSPNPAGFRLPQPSPHPAASATM